MFHYSNLPSFPAIKDVLHKYYINIHKAEKAGEKEEEKKSFLFSQTPKNNDLMNMDI